MNTDLAHDAWRLPPLSSKDLGPYADFPRLDDDAKAALWDAYNGGEPGRVPVTLGVNNRVFMLDERYNRDGLTYEQAFTDPAKMLEVNLRTAYLLRKRHNHFCDMPTEMPETWQLAPYFHNVYEAAGFGAPIDYPPDNVPGTQPILSDDRKRAIFDVDIDRPLEHGVYKRGIEMTHAMRKLAEGRTFLGRPIEVLPYQEPGSDGPLTVAMNLRGPAIFKDVRRDPEYVRELFDFIVTAAIKRIRAFREYWDLPRRPAVCLADDSIAMISASQYAELVLPHHRKWYDAVDPEFTAKRIMHLCGDATRHFKTIRDELRVSSFDTGFPVDFGALRDELGPEVEVMGGVEVPLLLDGTPMEVYERARSILGSGVLAGGRFALREANNLPPKVPWANLAAMYKAAFDFGRY